MIAEALNRVKRRSERSNVQTNLRSQISQSLSFTRPRLAPSHLPFAVPRTTCLGKGAPGRDRALRIAHVRIVLQAQGGPVQVETKDVPGEPARNHCLGLFRSPLTAVD